MSYQEKYLKYKSKYLALKLNSVGGVNGSSPDISTSTAPVAPSVPTTSVPPSVPTMPTIQVIENLMLNPFDQSTFTLPYSDHLPILVEFNNFYVLSWNILNGDDPFVFPMVFRDCSPIHSFPTYKDELSRYFTANNINRLDAILIKIKELIHQCRKPLIICLQEVGPSMLHYIMENQIPSYKTYYSEDDVVEFTDRRDGKHVQTLKKKEEYRVTLVPESLRHQPDEVINIRLYVKEELETIPKIGLGEDVKRSYKTSLITKIMRDIYIVNIHANFLSTIQNLRDFLLEINILPGRKIIIGDFNRGLIMATNRIESPEYRRLREETEALYSELDRDGYNVLTPDKQTFISKMNESYKLDQIVFSKSIV